MSTHMSQNTQSDIYCSRCDVTKTCDEFTKDKNRRGGKSIYCRDCMKEINKIIRKRNNEQRTEYNRQYRAVHREEYREWERENYKKRSEERRSQAKSWREKRHGTIKMMHLAARLRARKKQISYELSPEFIDVILSSQGDKCVLTGLDFVYESDSEYKVRPFAPSLDRKDTSKGYSLDNIQIVCIIANKARNEYSMEIFDQMCLARVEQLNRAR